MDEEVDLCEPMYCWLSVHPSYLDVFRRTVNQMMYGDGPLPLADRHFIALMAASRHQCQYLMDLHKHEFIRLGGSPACLQNGLCAASEKLIQLDRINRVLAHQPWIIQASDLEALSRCSDGHNWSLSELVQGAVILTHTHALCTFVEGCGIVSSQIEDPLVDDHCGEVDLLIDRMQQLRRRQSQPSQEDMARQFIDINVESSGIDVNTGDISGASGTTCSSTDPGPQFTKDPSFCYVDFVQYHKNTDSPVLKIHDYSWEDQGYSVVGTLYSQLSNLLDDKFRFVQELTYNTMGDHEGVDTSKFRTAVWNYIQSLYGIRHDDYDYAEVNQLLSRPMKTLVKTVCCYPERTTEDLRASCMTEFQYSEKVHVMVLALDARLQAELLYFLRAVMRFMA